MHELILGGPEERQVAPRRERASVARRPGPRGGAVATALAGDDEMRERIARHRADRAARVPGLRRRGAARAGRALRQHGAPTRLVVVDCLTLWLTNLLMPLTWRHDAADARGATRGRWPRCAAAPGRGAGLQRDRLGRVAAGARGARLRRRTRPPQPGRGGRCEPRDADGGRPGWTRGGGRRDDELSLHCRSPARRCSPAAPADAAARRPRPVLAPAAPPQRIVTLLPSLTETVCALGACERLVGVDRYSNWPPR